jgi:hypothetical protein
MSCFGSPASRWTPLLLLAPRTQACASPSRADRPAVADVQRGPAASHAAALAHVPLLLRDRDIQFRAVELRDPKPRWQRGELLRHHDVLLRDHLPPCAVALRFLNALDLACRAYREGLLAGTVLF